MITMSVGLPELENGIILVRDRLLYSVRSIGPLRSKSSYGFWGSAIAPQQGPGRNHCRNETFKTLHNIGEPSLL